MVSTDFRKQVSGYGLTTAHILYQRPDHHWLLQSYVWQNYDLFPNFPSCSVSLLSGRKSSRGHSIRCVSHTAS